MTKAKLILSVIAIFAIIGGAMAFKATRNAQQFFSTGTTTVNNVTFTYCTVPFRTLYSTTTTFSGQPGVAVTSFYSLPISLSSCPAITVYTLPQE
jgi:hypothetical protein